VAVVGGMHETFPGQAVVSNYPSEPHLIKATMLFRNCVSHPTVLMRRELFGPGKFMYHESRRFPEDYDLWMRVLREHLVVNLPEVLLKYRQSDTQTVASYRSEFVAAALEIQLSMIAWLGITPNDQQREIHHRLAENQIPETAEDLLKCIAWLQEILDANEQAKIYDTAALRRVLTGRWIAVARKLAATSAEDYARQKKSHWISGVTIEMP